MSGYDARFSGIQRLFASEGLARLRQAHVCVVGVGGVGSWAVEALARSGIGALTLIDLDDVCVSNVNRQLHALDGTLGRPKVEVLAKRVQLINPECTVYPVLAFVTLNNDRELLSQHRFDYVLDAIDSPTKKASLIATCKAMNLPVITTGGAGGRRDPTQVKVSDLAFTSHDRLTFYVRRWLRVHHGFPRGQEPFGVQCVHSPEPAVFPQADGSVCCERPENLDLRLDCRSGFGTASFVTGAFGFAAASRIVQHIATAEKPSPAPAAEQNCANPVETPMHTPVSTTEANPH